MANNTRVAHVPPSHGADRNRLRSRTDRKRCEFDNFELLYWKLTFLAEELGFLSENQYFWPGSLARKARGSQIFN